MEYGIFNLQAKGNRIDFKQIFCGPGIAYKMQKSV
jgi:hypothetical protein